MAKFLDSLGLARVRDWVKANFARLSHTHTKSEITDFPTIPSKTSDLTNDSGFITSSAIAAVTGIKGDAESTYRSGNVNLTPANIGAAAASHGNHVPATQTANNKIFLRNDNTWQTITPANIGAAASSHGNHVPTTQTANNKIFLRNDNTWQTITPANIGAAASSHSHTRSQISDWINNFTATILWTNSAYTSTFAAQTVTLSANSANYKFLLIAVMNSTSNSNAEFNCVLPGLTNKINNAGYSDNAIRTVTISGSSVTFSAAQHGSSSTANSYAIPYRIWGIA